jgi:hypothetical protein
LVKKAKKQLPKKIKQIIQSPGVPEVSNLAARDMDLLSIRIFQWKKKTLFSLKRQYVLNVENHIFQMRMGVKNQFDTKSTSRLMSVNLNVKA